MARQMPEMALTVITPSIRILQTLMSRRSLHLVGLGAILDRRVVLRGNRLTNATRICH